jgi:putative PIN family toxin of toxin-antitoxin system
MIRAVLDTNIFISAVIRPEGPPGRLFCMFIENAAFDLVITPAIVDEIRAAMDYPGVKKQIRSAVPPSDWLDDVLLFADINEDSEHVKGVAEDPADDMFLSAALSGHALYIVTGDRHLLELKQHQGVKIVTPREFLSILRTAKP